jgi:hypothetical protein
VSTLCHARVLRGCVVLLEESHRQREVIAPHTRQPPGRGEVPRTYRAANRHTPLSWPFHQLSGLNRALNPQRKLLQLKLALWKYVISHIRQHSGSRRVNLSRELCAEIDKFGAHD